MDLWTEKLYLRELNWPDAVDIHRLNSLPEVAQFNTIGIPKSLEVTRALIRPVIEDRRRSVRRRYGWVILSRNGASFLGEVGMSLGLTKFKSAEIYYSLLPQYWGQGYATEAVRGMLAFGFGPLRLHRIEAGVATENSSSIRVLEKVGMSREGLHRQVRPIGKDWKDNYHYAILESEWKTTPPFPTPRSA